ncbi:hypothetical protein [Aquisalimonas sp.]|uniref:hypothetical protein n=1 Tax=Aquisalimonas sp. TaxID=1872621 RepID=UPI0025C3EFAC|nr:hypothetical protein [Aquisalimonas sp.]
MTADDTRRSERRNTWLERVRKVLRRKETVRDPDRAAQAEIAAGEALAHCFRESVLPALGAVRDRLNEEGYAATVEAQDRQARLTAVRDEATYCVYQVEGRLYHKPAFAFPALHGKPDRPQYACLHIECEGQSQEWDIRHCSYEALYEDALGKCHRWLEW